MGIPYLPPVLTLGAYQFEAKLGDVRYNLDRIAAVVAGLSPGEVDILAFPEMCDTGYAMDVIRRQAVSWPADHLQAIQSQARAKGTAVLLGLSKRVEADIFNTVAVIDRQGELVFNYRKSHLVTIAPIHEQRTITPGDTLGHFNLDGRSCGVLTCYELRFPEIARTLALKGAEILFVPAAWPVIRLDHLLVLARARAIENQVFLVLCCRVGTDAATTFSGVSMILDPDGRVLAAGEQSGEELLKAAFDPAAIDDSRRRIGALNDRRSDLYG